jgi:hypothetical protein
MLCPVSAASNETFNGNLATTTNSRCPTLFESLTVLSFVGIFCRFSTTTISVGNRLCRRFCLQKHVLVAILVAQAVLVPKVHASSSTPPITAGLIAHYNADSWTGARWTDLSGTGNHVTEFGGATPGPLYPGPPLTSTHRIFVLKIVTHRY